ncbi:MAG: SHOCT domain-containing protein [Phycisphaerales bacterium]
MLTAAFNLTFTLGQSARTARAQGDIWFYLGVLVVAAVVIAVIGLIARKYLSEPIEASEGEAVFDLSELRKLHRHGQLTDDEFEAAKAAVLMNGADYLSKDSTGAERPTRPTPRPAGDADIELGPELLGPTTHPERGGEPDNGGDDENRSKD